jgi:hypothetical protein
MYPYNKHMLTVVGGEGFGGKYAFSIPERAKIMAVIRL